MIAYTEMWKKNIDRGEEKTETKKTIKKNTQSFIMRYQAGHVAINVLQGGWDAIGSMLAIQLVKWWCRVQDVFPADSAEAFTSTLLRWPSTSKCIATRRPASYVTPLSVVEPTCDVICVWNITCNGKKRSRGNAARKKSWTHNLTVVLSSCRATSRVL